VVYHLEGPFSLRAFDRTEARSLLSYGGWVTLTNLAYPFLMSAPQVLIGSMIGVSAVPHFTVPMSFVSRISTIPLQLGRTFFPRMSGESPEAAHALATRALSAVAYGFAAICAPAIVLAPTFFRYWMGADFAADAGPIAQILFLGAWMGGVSFIAYTLLQGQGRPDLTGKLHIAQLLPFLGILWFLTMIWGIYGAAIAWSLRATVDAAVMLWAAELRRSDVFSVVRPAVLLCACVAAGQFIGSNLTYAFPAACLAGLGFLALARSYSDELRRLMDSQLSRARTIVEHLMRRAKLAQPANPTAPE
jgi:O-antigen/teichoic acid export membrane protein